ncbi:hypothetical protein [Fusibacter sp. JL216-2]|uniref:hypothetical protein n=1 Tax=Fusibacter sp. JL216-2 TaxID=3071453 RepID=UPI003D33F295
MNPIRSIEEVIENWHVFENKWHTLYAFALYTREDKNIAQYIREYFMEMDRLSGNDCLIFVIEKPPSSWSEEAKTREYWSDVHQPEELWSGYYDVMPYDSSQVYDLARKIGLKYRNIPCLVFFKDINDREYITYAIDTSWSQSKITLELRKLFSKLSDSDNRVNASDKDVLWENLRKYVAFHNRKVEKNYREDFQYEPREEIQKLVLKNIQNSNISISSRDISQRVNENSILSRIVSYILKNN